MIIGFAGVKKNLGGPESRHLLACQRYNNMLYSAYKKMDPDLKKLFWVKSSKKDLMRFPDEVRREIGYALYCAQLGETHSSAKIFKGYGSGIYEIVSNYNTDTYRAIYVARLKGCVYVLHSFQKKSKTGITTPKKDLNVIKERLKYLQIMLK